MTKSKICTECNELKPLTEFYKGKNNKFGVRSKCKKCHRKNGMRYHQEHKEERKEEVLKRQRQRYGHISMYENKSCPAYLGIVIGERLCRHLFKDVEVMPYGNTGYDIICNKGKKIDVKSSCIRFNNGKYPRWAFEIDHNKMADFFILVAFDNRRNLNPLHLWMIPGNEINENSSKTICPSTIDKWSQWERDIKDAQLCCTEMKKELIM